MTFSVDTWQEQIRQKARQTKQWLRQRRDQDAPYLLYGYLCSLGLWPLVTAAQSGELLPVMMALGSVAGGVGGNLLANQIQKWQDQAGELDQEALAGWVAANAAGNEALRQALDDILDQLKVIGQTQAGLAGADRQWFADTLRAELSQLGNLSRFEARLGQGAIAQGPGATSVASIGAGSAAVGRIEGDAYFNITPPDPTPSPLLRTSPGHLRAAYLSRLYQQCRTLSLSGIDPKAASDESAARLKLGAIYTALLTLSPEQQQRFSQGELPERGEKRQPALAQLNRHKRLVLLGDPGSGKSTFVNFIALCLAGAGLDQAEFDLEDLTAPLPDDEGQIETGAERQPWEPGALLPVRVILRDFAAQGLPPDETQPTGAGHLWDFIAADLAAASLTEYAPSLQAELQDPAKGGLLLLDGLDEVPEAYRRRVQLKQAVEDFAGSYPHCRILVTSRTYAYQKQEWRLDDFAEAALAPFSRGQIVRFIERWYDQIALLRGLKADDARGQAEQLKQAIFKSERLYRLAERPLLLTLTASLHAWRGGALPEKREALYAEAVELLLDTWESYKLERDAQGRIIDREPSLTEWLKVDREAVRGLLNQLAFEAHAAQPETTGTADIPQSKLIEGLLALSRNDLVTSARLVNYLRDRAGLLLAHGVGVYSFPHRTFQEYLAACHLVNETFPQPVADLTRSDPNRWREVALLAAATAGRASIWSFVEHLCQIAPPAAGTVAATADVWGAHLAAQALVEVADTGNVHPVHQAKLERVKGWLTYILATPATSPPSGELEGLPATERAIAGQNLALLGDERLGVGVRPDGLPDIIWCEVPAGPFLMGSDPAQDEQAYEDEQPQHTLDLPAFHISKYPITNCQYQAFVLAGGYQNPDYWAEAIEAGYWQVGQVKRLVAWLEGDDVKTHEEWTSAPADFGEQFGLDNQPVVGLNWYEAIAFSRWLTEQLRNQGLAGGEAIITLPSEAEWEKAARGTDGRRYPWGNSPDPNCANYAGTIGATSPVGCFPGGASPYGVEEMSGNVWEWTRSLWQDEQDVLFAYPYDPADGRKNLEASDRCPRALRGGSFFNDEEYVRCAVRYGFVPFIRNYYYGFRVALVGAASSPL